MFVSPGGVRSVWLRHDLETFKKRLTALEAKVEQEGLILTESQLTAMEKKKEEDKARGQIETEHPGYLGAQDTYYFILHRECTYDYLRNSNERNSHDR